MDALWTPQERMGVEQMLVCSAVGGPDRVTAQLNHILAQTQADELIVAGAVYDHAARVPILALHGVTFGSLLTAYSIRGMEDDNMKSLASFDGRVRTRAGGPLAVLAFPFNKYFSGSVIFLNQAFSQAF